MTTSIPPREKYKVLYEYQKLQFEDEKNQYFKLEDKSSKYLAFLNIFIPIFILLFTSFYKKTDLNLFSNIALIGCVLLSFACLCSAWSLIFRSLKLMAIPKLPSGLDVIDFFHDNDNLESIYCYKAKLYCHAIVDYKLTNQAKIDLINLAYRDIAWGSAIFMISVIIIFIVKIIGL